MKQTASHIIIEFTNISKAVEAEFKLKDILDATKG
jgi:hypothetical protein